jgi:DNA-binding NtrC family response regulator
LKGWLSVGCDNKTKPSILLVDSDRAALDAVQEELSDEFAIYRAFSVDEACTTFSTYRHVSAVALTVNDRNDNHAAMMRFREHVQDRPIILVLGFPSGPDDYVPPSGFDPFGQIHKGENPDHLVLLLREAVRLQRQRQARGN